jgi:hypothetical protein
MAMDERGMGVVALTHLFVSSKIARYPILL